MHGRNVKHGMRVTLSPALNKPGMEGEWIVLERSPRPGSWWLHRWINGQWQTTEAHARNLDYRGPGDTHAMSA